MIIAHAAPNQGRAKLLTGLDIDLVFDAWEG
jgi:hypothetical protein